MFTYMYLHVYTCTVIKNSSQYTGINSLVEWLDITRGRDQTYGTDLQYYVQRALFSVYVSLNTHFFCF